MSSSTDHHNDPEAGEGALNSAETPAPREASLTAARDLESGEAPTQEPASEKPLPPTTDDRRRRKRRLALVLFAGACVALAAILGGVLGSAAGKDAPAPRPQDLVLGLSVAAPPLSLATPALAATLEAAVASCAGVPDVTATCLIDAQARTVLLQVPGFPCDASKVPVSNTPRLASFFALRFPAADAPAALQKSVADDPVAFAGTCTAALVAADPSNFAASQVGAADVAVAVSALSSKTPSPSATPSRSTSATSSVSPSTTPSSSFSPSTSVTGSITPTASKSSSISPSTTPSISVTSSITSTPSTSATGSGSTTPSITISASKSASTSVSASGTPSNSASPSLSSSKTPSSSTTPSPSISVTATPSVTPSRSISPSASATGTVSATSSPSNTPSATSSSSGSASLTLTPSQTPTASGSKTASISPTPSSSPSASTTPSPTSSSSESASITSTPSRTPSVSGSKTPSISPTPSSSPSASTAASPSTTATASATKTAASAFLTGAAAAANWAVTSYAGLPPFKDGQGTAAGFAYPTGLTFDAAGNAYVCDSDNTRLRKVSATYTVSTVAGTGEIYTSVDGAALSVATFKALRDVALDATAGIVYIADDLAHNLRALTLASGTVSTLAGSSSASGFVDATGTAARFDLPSGICVDGAGNVFVADTLNHAIRKVSPGGVVTTLAGNGNSGSANGVGAAASFDRPMDVACDGAGNVFVSDHINSAIRKIVVATATVSTLATGILRPSFIDIDKATGDLYVVNLQQLLLVSSSGVVSVVAGDLMDGSLVDDASGANVRFKTLAGVAFNPANGKLAATDMNLVREVTIATGETRTVAGYLRPGSIDGAAGINTFTTPVGLDIDASGNIYIGDATRLRMVAPDGSVTTVAGSDTAMTVDDPLGANAMFSAVEDVCISGNTAYVVDSTDLLLRAVDLTTTAVTTAAGSGYGYTDGAALQATFATPRSCAVMPDGKVVIADTRNYVIRIFDPVAATVATYSGSGTKGVADAVGILACYSSPQAVTASKVTGIVYVADECAVRKIAADGTVSTIAGSTTGFVDGPAANALFGIIYDLAVDPQDGSIIICDLANTRVRRLSATGYVSTIAGGRAGFSEGSGDKALLSPFRVGAGAANGVFFVADTAARMVRKLTRPP